MANWEPDEVARLAVAIKRRRAHLGMTQIDMWRAGGPSNSTLTAIESGLQTNITGSTLRKIDASLGWEGGTAVTILEGGETKSDQTTVPPPLGDVPTATLAQIAAEALSEIRRRIAASDGAPDNAQGWAWRGLNPGGHWPEDDEGAQDLGER